MTDEFSGGRRAQAVLLAMLVFGIALGDRAFAYWHVQVGRVPLFVTEAFLILTVGVFLFNAGFRRLSDIGRLEGIAWAILYAAAFQSLIRGLASQPPTNVLRDFAIVHYSVFYFLIRFAVRDRRLLYGIALAFAAAVVLKLPMGAVQLVAPPWWSSQPAAMGMYFSIFILAAFFLAPTLGRWTAVVGLLAGAAGALLILYQVRTCWLAFMSSLLVVAVVMARHLSRKHAVFAGYVFVVAAIGTALGHANVASRPGASSLAEVRSFSDLIRDPESLVGETFPDRAVRRDETEGSYSNEGNRDADEAQPLIRTRPSLSTVRTRLWMWGDLLMELKDDGTWILGVPFGRAWMPPRIVPWWDLATTRRIDPHNSHLAILYRVGVFGFLGYGAVVMMILWRGARSLGSKRPSIDRLALGAAISAVVYCLVHAATDVTLENPFKGIFLWLCLGIVSSLSAPSGAAAKELI